MIPFENTYTVRKL